LNSHFKVYLSLILLAVSMGISAAEEIDVEALALEVEMTERAFARSMAQRDFMAFKSFLSEEAVFLAGRGAFRGKNEVAEAWAELFIEDEAPFSWEPTEVQVLDSGRLALSTGPVYNRAGKRNQTYTSTWRLEEDGKWRIIFDKGDRYCPRPSS
jgi:ketosteroid isomerase-like protein